MLCQLIQKIGAWLDINEVSVSHLVESVEVKCHQALVQVPIGIRRKSQ